MRNKNWFKIWENKALEQTKDLHKIDGWDMLSTEEYRDLVYSCLVGHEQDLLHPNLNMLEVACGSGAFIQALKLKYPLINIRGIDYSPKLIQNACRNFEDLKFDVLDMNWSLREWKKVLGVKPFDIIFSYSALYYLDSIEDVQDVLSKMLSILSKSGKIILGELNDLNKIDALNIRKESHKHRKVKSKHISADHLFISKDIFIQFSKKNNLELDFLNLPSWYPASEYRYHVILKKK